MKRLSHILLLTVAAAATVVTAQTWQNCNANGMDLSAIDSTVFAVLQFPNSTTSGTIFKWRFNFCRTSYTSCSYRYVSQMDVYDRCVQGYSTFLNEGWRPWYGGWSNALQTITGNAMLNVTLVCDPNVVLEPEGDRFVAHQPYGTEGPWTTDARLRTRYVCPRTTSPRTTTAAPASYSDCSIACPMYTCESSPCNASSDRFLCMTGPAAGGCSRTASTWENNAAICGACCNVCPSVPKPTVPSINCDVECPTSTCEQSPCDVSTQPYLCLRGPASGSCAVSNHTWGESPSVCTACCNVARCRNCNTPCNGTWATWCPSSQPYTCTAGNIQGSCTAKPDLWPSLAVSECGSCCTRG